MFRDREEAARLLAERLASYRGSNPLVLGVPRGAVPMAAIIAEALDGDLDVILVRKLGAPGQPELAIGAVDEGGRVFLEGAASDLGVGERYLEAERRTQLQLLAERRKRYTPARDAVDPAGRVVIVVDNGIATGATLIAALRAVRERDPARLVAAAAVAPKDTVRKLRQEADEVVILEQPDNFIAVGAHFEDFSQVSDEEVVEHLSRGRARREGKVAEQSGA